MLLLMLFALIAGAGTAITPCVLPVLPALLSASAPAAGAARSGSCIGLAVTFTIAIVAAGPAGQGRRAGQRGGADAGDRRADRVRHRDAGPRSRRARAGAAVAPGPLRPQDPRRRLLVGHRRRRLRSGSCARRAPGRSSPRSRRSAPRAARRPASCSWPIAYSVGLCAVLLVYAFAGRARDRPDPPRRARGHIVERALGRRAAR